MPVITIKAKFEFGDIVYVITDLYQFKGIITAISKAWNGGIEYEVSFDNQKSWYQAVELSLEKDTTVKPPALEEEDEED